MQFLLLHFGHGHLLVAWLEVHGKRVSPISSLFPDRGKVRESKDWLRALNTELSPVGVKPAAVGEGPLIDMGMETSRLRKHTSHTGTVGPA